MAAKNGDLVRVFYTGTLEDGTEFDSNIGDQPMEFRLGDGNLIPGFEKAVIGLEVGGEVTTTIPPEEAYGAHNPDETIVVPRSEVPENIDPEVGMMVQLAVEGNTPLEVIISHVDEDEVVLDANHPLAGKVLIFKIQLTEIVG